MSNELHVVTGAFGYTGRYIARRLIEQGHRVRTLVRNPARHNPFGGQVEVDRLAFDDPSRLHESLSGAAVLYNTSWVRFEHAGATFDQAVENVAQLFEAARAAGVGRIVHISVANASSTSSLPYFRGKGQLEERLNDIGVSHAIIRPTVLFGGDDILINNIAWFLRRFPIFGIPGNGQYLIQPVHVEDVANLAVDLAKGDQNTTVDAVGPETFTFKQLVQLLRQAVGGWARIVHVPESVALMIVGLVGKLLGDVVLTRDEINALASNLLACPSSPTCPTRFTEWLEENATALGSKYASEIARHFR